MNFNLHKLHTAFKKNFNPSDFTRNMLSKTEPILYVQDQGIPATAGIPLTDIFLYGYQRIKSMGIEEAHYSQALYSRFAELVNQSNAAFQTVTISTKENVTFLEVYFAGEAQSKSDGSLSDLSKLEKVIARSPPEMKLSENPSLALISLRLAGGKSSQINFMDGALKYSSVRHLLENEADKLSERLLINLIDSAVDQQIDLSTLKLRDKHLLKDVINIIAEPEVIEKYEAARVKQRALQFVEQNSEHIDHTFNPDLYFDF